MYQENSNGGSGRFNFGDWGEKFTGAAQGFGERIKGFGFGGANNAAEEEAERLRQQEQAQQEEHMNGDFANTVLQKIFIAAQRPQTHTEAHVAGTASRVADIIRTQAFVPDQLGSVGLNVQAFIDITATVEQDMKSRRGNNDWIDRQLTEYGKKQEDRANLIAGLAEQPYSVSGRVTNKKPATTPNTENTGGFGKAVTTAGRLVHGGGAILKNTLAATLNGHPENALNDLTFQVNEKGEPKLVVSAPGASEEQATYNPADFNKGWTIRTNFWGNNPFLDKLQGYINFFGGGKMKPLWGEIQVVDLGRQKSFSIPAFNPQAKLKDIEQLLRLSPEMPDQAVPRPVIASEYDYYRMAAQMPEMQPILQAMAAQFRNQAENQ